MNSRDWFKFSVIGSMWQRPAELLRELTKVPRRLKHPELVEIYREDARIDKFMRKHITKKMNCLDIGCHLGRMLDKMIRLAPDGRHVAVEPIPYKAEWLHTKYPEVVVHQTALADKDGETTLFYEEQYSGYSGLRRPRTSGTSRQIKVKLRRLDGLIPEDVSIGFIKIDVEGAELKVLRGARRILRKKRPIVLFECARSSLSAFDLVPADIFGFLNDEVDYRVFLIKDWLGNGSSLSVESFETALNYPFKGRNFLAVPAESNI